MDKEKKILVVDDDFHLKDALKRSLKKAGYSVETADSIENCRNKLMEFIPDLILLDVVLPDGNGIDFIKEFTTNDLYNTVGVLLMSGLQTEKDYAQKGIENGALYFMRKPFQINELNQVIDLFFKVRQLEQNRLQLEERYNLFFNNANDIFFVTDKNGKLLNLSKSFEEITGIPVSKTSQKNFSQFVGSISKDKWEISLERIAEGGVLPSFEIYIINTFNNLIPVDIQLTKSVLTEKNEMAIIGIAKDLRAIKLLEDDSGETETEKKNKRRELEIWEKMTIPNTRLTEITYEVSALNDEKSDIFENMVKAYRLLVEQAIEQRIYKIENENSLRQRMFANELGFLKAGPKDLIKIHTTFYKTLKGNVNTKKATIYHEEARIILLAVLGYLVSFYKNRNSSAL